MIDERKLIREIIVLVLFLVIIVPICVDASNNYNKQEEYLDKLNRVFIDISSSNKEVTSDNIISNKVITISNENDENINIYLMFKIYKFTNSYTVEIGDKKYNLDELDYVEDDEYLYYNLGLFEIDDTSKLDFRLILNNDISYDSSVSYSFSLKGI